jgi:hypothetical protein
MAWLPRLRSRGAAAIRPLGAPCFRSCSYRDRARPVVLDATARWLPTVRRPGGLARPVRDSTLPRLALRCATPFEELFGHETPPRPRARYLLERPASLAPQTLSALGRGTAAHGGNRAAARAAARREGAALGGQSRALGSALGVGRPGPRPLFHWPARHPGLGAWAPGSEAPLTGDARRAQSDVGATPVVALGVSRDVLTPSWGRVLDTPLSRSATFPGECAAYWIGVTLGTGPNPVVERGAY